MLLPEAWVALDFDPASRDESIEEMVRRTLGTEDASVPVHRWAADTYRKLFDDAASTGMFFGAHYRDELAGRALSASVLAFVTEVPIDPDGNGMALDAIAAALAQSDGGDERAVEPPQVLRLPVGFSVRTRVRMGGCEPDVEEYEADAPDHPRYEIDVVRFFTPVYEWGLMLVIAFSTPNLAAAGAFAELFDSLAATARWKD